MRFGVSLLGLAQQPRTEDMVQRFEELLAFVHTARDEGLDHLTTGQHYLTDPFQQFQPAPLLGRLIPESGDMRLVSTLVATLHRPVDLAETWATLDVLSGGRITLSLALGYRAEEYTAFGVAPEKRLRHFKDTVTTLRQLWTEERVTYRGEGFSLEDASVTLRPTQRPHPPIWIAANADQAIERAARWGLPWNINAHARIETIVRQVALYRAAADDAGHPFQGLPMSREMFCAPTREEAIAHAGPFLAQKYDAYDRWGQDEALPGDEEFAVPFEDLARDRFVIGDPDDCAREIERYRQLGVQDLHLRMNWPGMSLETALDGLQLFTREVVPRFRGRQEPT